MSKPEGCLAPETCRLDIDLYSIRGEDRLCKNCRERFNSLKRETVDDYEDLEIRELEYPHA